MKKTAYRTISILLAVLLAIVSYYGGLVSGTYVHETTSFAVQGMGQDVFDLLFVVPVLITSSFYMVKNNKTSMFIYGGTLFYILYSFLIYSFGVHFNKLFLLYCLTLGVSLYAFIFFIYQVNKDYKLVLSPKAPITSIWIYFLVIATLFYMLWLKDIIPALYNNSVPKDVTDNFLLVNPVHVLDIALALPGLIITAFLLKRRHTIGILMTPIFLVFTILLALALVSMAIMLNIKEISEDLSIAGVFIILAIISIIYLVRYLRNLHITLVNGK